MMRRFNDLAALTEREKTIARYVASGLGNGQIGQLLSVQTNTITNRLRIIADKLEAPEGYSSRVWVARAVWEADQNA